MTLFGAMALMIFCLKAALPTVRNDFLLHSAIQPASDADDTILDNERKFDCITNVLMNVCNYVNF